MRRQLEGRPRHRGTAPLRNALRLLHRPIPLEKAAILAARWDSLDPRWRRPTQGFGRQATGCGATIGIHPRCDFDCDGCYLGANANRVPRRSRDDIFRQLEALRAFLGPKGNVQITDGEVTLLPVDDLVAVLRQARALDLLPMVMTHGDTFRRQPGLLERLITEGGLTEMAVHIDTTQRGRLGYKDVEDEVALMPLREEFAALIRTARAATGVALRAAMTMTITRDNLGGVVPVVAWSLRNRDVFRLISFQPLARVGRTRGDVTGVTAQELWLRIGEALRPYGAENPTAGPFLFGHPDCSRVELMAVYQQAGLPPRVVNVARHGASEDAAMLDDFYARGLGGINFRGDTTLGCVCRTLGLAARHARWLVGPARRWVTARLRGVGTSPARLVWDLIRGRVQVDGFSIVSHHFMSREEVCSAIGRERLAACAFKVPVHGRMVSMCEVNASGVRAAFYAEQAHGRPGTLAAPAPPQRGSP